MKMQRNDNHVPCMDDHMGQTAAGVSPAECELFIPDKLWVVLAGLHHGSQIPQLDGLILAVTNQVPAIALGVQMGHAVCVTNKQANWLGGAAHCALVPYLQPGSVWAVDI